MSSKSSVLSRKKWLLATAVCITLLIAYVRVAPADWKTVAVPMRKWCPLRKRRADAVILLTQCRTGSSFVGEIFNQRREVAYFYEPLYPFRASDCVHTPARLANESVRALRGIVHCDFTDVPALYRKGFASTKQPDQAGCLANKMCFVNCGKCSQFMWRDRKAHSVPLDLSALGQHCRTSRFRVAKVNYLAKLELIAPMLDDSYDVNVKVVHLVRDPRATIASKMRSDHVGGERALEYSRRAIGTVCSRLRDNAAFADERLRRSADDDDCRSPPRYLRVRHEDFSLAPVESARAIYHFIGDEVTDEVLEWLRRATAASNSAHLSRAEEYGTRRNSEAVVSAWRRELAYDVVAEIQDACADAMRRLEYRAFDSADELRNFNLSSFR